MQVIKQTGAGTVSTTTGYALRGVIAVGGTVTVRDGAARDLMELPAAGSFVLPGPIQCVGLVTAGTATSIYLYVE